MNILIDCDKNYVYQTMTLIFSLSKNIKESIHYFYISYKDVNTDKIIKKLQSKIRKIDFFTEIRVPRISIQSSGRWSEQAYIRLIGLLYLPEDVKRILRIDSDVIVNDEINEFYNSTFLKNNILGTKETMEWVEKHIIDLKTKDPFYINSGVVLFDVDFYKKKIGNVEQLEKMINSFDLGSAIDQDFINVLYDNNKVYWKDDTYMRFCAKYHVISPDYKSNNPIIFHYAGFHRPWKYQGFVNYRRLYWKYGIKCFPFYKFLFIHILRLGWLVIYPLRKVFHHV